MYEKEIISLLEKLDNNEKKEILNFAEFLNNKHVDINKTNKSNSLEKLGGIFNNYSNPGLISVEKEKAWETYIKAKYLDK